MEIEVGVSIVLFIVLLCSSAFFSGSESAFFSLSEADIRGLKEQTDSKSAGRVLRLLKRPRRLLMSILIGNTVVNVAAATVAALFTSRIVTPRWLGKGGEVVLVIVVVTLVILIFSEVSPKVFAVRQPSRFASVVSLPLAAVVTVFRPVAVIFEWITKRISKLLGVEREIPIGDEEELKTLFELGEEKGTLDRNEREMIDSIFEFRETMTKEVMVPRMDMVRVEQNMPIEEVLAIVKEKGHSRIPVYDDKVDNIVGILFVKDLLPYLGAHKEVPALKDLARKAYFVPESKMIDELLREFQKERIHMAIVVDEYGGTAGLVTLEDVIEEIVGEIRDEYDKEKPLYREVGEKMWLVEAKINIEDLNEALKLEIPTEEDFESLGGFLFALLGRIPEEKEEVEYDDLHITIEKVSGQRIERVRLQKHADSEKKSL